MDRIAHRLRARRAFTLVELLTVIVIIGILAGLITAAAVRGRTRANVVGIKSEITQLEMALEAYKQKFGEYPPDLTDLAALDRHLKRAFPRYPGNAATFLNSVAAAYGINSPDLTKLGPASALVIFLGGIPEQPGSSKPAGFHADPKNPFQWGQPRTQPFFEFDVSRLMISDPANPNTLLCQYRPAKAATPAPYVYFKCRRLALPTNQPRFQYDEYAYVDNNGAVHPLSYAFAPDSICVPYLEFNPTAAVPNPLPPQNQLDASGVNPRQWAEAGKFQIICAGLDGRFGNGLVGGSPQEFRYRRLGLNFSDDGGDFDNITNFSEGTLEDELE